MVSYKVNKSSLFDFNMFNDLNLNSYILYLT